MGKLYIMECRKAIASFLFIFYIFVCPSYSQIFKVCERPKHEFNVTLGPGQIVSPEDHFASCTTLKGFLCKDVYFSNEDLNNSMNYNLVYMYNVSGRLGFGFQTGYSENYGRHELRSKYYYNWILATGKYNCLFFMPTVRMYWYSNEYFGIYSRVGCGIGFRKYTESDECPNDDLDFGADSYRDNSFEYQIHPICLDFTYKHFGMLLELGVGIQPTVVGLKYSF